MNTFPSSARPPVSRRPRNKSVRRPAFEGGWVLSALSHLSYHASVERLGPILIPRVVWRGPRDGPFIALTFDDGPHPEFTPRVLEILDRNAVRATFFQIGRYIQQYPETTKSVIREGHECGNHSFSHSLLPRLSDNEVGREIRSTHELLVSLGAAKPLYFRPPMGIFSRRVLNVIEETGYRTVIGDVYPRDAHRPGSSKIVRRVRQRAVAGSIIILHDGGNTEGVDRRQTVEALGSMVPALKEQGFNFVTVSALLSPHA